MGSGKGEAETALEEREVVMRVCPSHVPLHPEREEVKVGEGRREINARKSQGKREYNLRVAPPGCPAGDTDT